MIYMGDFLCAVLKYHVSDEQYVHVRAYCEHAQMSCAEI